ncbi:MAG: ferredoxin [Candidatus Woesearchaeota archaeon]
MQIIHDREGCIGCKSCASILPEHWVMSGDGKATLKDAKHNTKMSDNLKHLDCAYSCPVNVIHVEHDGKRIV